MTVTTAVKLTLRQFVAAKLPDGVTDFHAAAREIVALIPHEDRDEYLAQAVVGVVSEITGQRRRAAFDAMRDHDDNDDETSAPGTGHPFIETHHRDAGAGGGVKPGTAEQNFARPDRHRDYWAGLLNSVGLAADGGRKRVGDMTVADLHANIDYRTELARENLARAEQFRELLVMVEAQGVDTVGDLVLPGGDT